MRQHYLKLLGLRDDASEKEIKKKYRTLVKKYHPDINPSADAHDKFLEIDEAYEYLTRKEAPAYESYQKEWVDPEVVARQERIRKARERAWKKRQEELRRLNHVLSKLQYVIVVIGCVNVMLLVDSWLPNKTVEEEIVSIRIPGQEPPYIPYAIDYELINDGVREFNTVLMKDHVMIIDRKSSFPRSKHVTLSKSFLFGISESMMSDGAKTHVLYSLYRIFGVILYIQVLSMGLFFYYPNKLEFRAGMIALMTVMFCLQCLAAYNSMIG